MLDHHRQGPKVFGGVSVLQTLDGPKMVFHMLLPKSKLYTKFIA